MGHCCSGVRAEQQWAWAESFGSRGLGNKGARYEDQGARVKGRGSRVWVWVKGLGSRVWGLCRHSDGWAPIDLCAFADCSSPLNFVATAVCSALKGRGIRKALLGSPRPSLPVLLGPWSRRCRRSSERLLQPRHSRGRQRAPL